MCEASRGRLLERIRRVRRSVGVWPLAVLALVGPYLFWFLLRP